MLSNFAALARFAGVLCRLYDMACAIRTQPMLKLLDVIPIEELVIPSFRIYTSVDILVQIYWCSYTGVS